MPEGVLRAQELPEAAIKEICKQVSANRPTRWEPSDSRGKPTIIEIAAGSAGLAFELANEGFQALPLDHSWNRHKQKIRCIVVDASTERGLELILRLIAEYNVVYICWPTLWHTPQSVGDPHPEGSNRTWRTRTQAQTVCGGTVGLGHPNGQR